MRFVKLLIFFLSLSLTSDFSFYPIENVEITEQQTSVADKPDSTLPPPEHVRVFAKIQDGTCSIVFKAHLNDPKEQNTTWQVLAIEKALEKLLAEKTLRCALKTPFDAAHLFRAAQLISQNNPERFTKLSVEILDSNIKFCLSGNRKEDKLAKVVKWSKFKYYSIIFMYSVILTMVVLIYLQIDCLFLDESNFPEEFFKNPIGALVLFVFCQFLRGIKCLIRKAIKESFGESFIKIFELVGIGALLAICFKIIMKSTSSTTKDWLIEEKLYKTFNNNQKGNLIKIRSFATQPLSQIVSQALKEQLENKKCSVNPKNPKLVKFGKFIESSDFYITAYFVATALVTLTTFKVYSWLFTGSTSRTGTNRPATAAQVPTVAQVPTPQAPMIPAQPLPAPAAQTPAAAT